LNKGYKVKVTKHDSIKISGIPFNYPFAIPLKTGWNIIGYPQNLEYNGFDIVQQLIDKGTLIKVMDEQGNSIEDWGIYGGWLNNIGNFLPGEGYKVKVNTDDTLWIYENYPKSSMKNLQHLATSHFKPSFIGNGVDHMSFNLVGLSQDILEKGDEIAVYDGIICIGAVKIQEYHLTNQMISIPASSADVEGMPGFKQGNNYFLRIWKKESDSEFELNPDIIKGSETFTKNESIILSLEKYATTDIGTINNNGLSEIKCYPNPFNDEINIKINLVKDSEVSVEVLNQMGQVVRYVSINQILNSGNHKITWDGKNESNSTVSPGIYHLRAQIGGETIHKKIIYSKQ
jgi:hypothetical protein